MLCIYIQLCTVLRKAKQDDSELLVGLLPFQVFEKKWEHFHQLICILPFWLLFLFTFPQIASSLPFFSDFSEINDKRGRLKTPCACSHARSPRRKKGKLLVV